MKQILYYWFLAARPKTLAGGAVPVLVGVAFAIHEGCVNIIPALLCLLFALFAQIGANFSNDYFDFKHGADRENRLGPSRALGSGWIKPNIMLRGIVLVLAIACCCGLGLIPYGGWSLIWVGLLSVIFCLLYTAGPIPLSYIGMGDILVVIFFGLVPVSFTFYVQSNYWIPEVWWIAGGVGLVVNNILVSNNYRDQIEDRQNHKYTTIVLFGSLFGRLFYLFNGLTAVIITISYFIMDNFAVWTWFLPLVYLLAHLRAWRLLSSLEGRDLYRVLEASAKNLVLYGILFFCCMCWG